MTETNMTERLLEQQMGSLERHGKLKEEIIASLKRENQILKEEVVPSLKRENQILKEEVVGALKRENQALREQFDNLKGSSEAVIRGLPEVLQAAHNLSSLSQTQDV